MNILWLLDYLDLHSLSPWNANSILSLHNLSACESTWLLSLLSASTSLLLSDVFNFLQLGSSSSPLASSLIDRELRFNRLRFEWSRTQFLSWIHNEPANLLDPVDTYMNNKPSPRTPLSLFSQLAWGTMQPWKGAAPAPPISSYVQQVQPERFRQALEQSTDFVQHIDARNSISIHKHQWIH